MNYSEVLKENQGSFLKASSADDLLETLAAVDIFVPGRTKGRTKEHTERYSICHLLSTLAETGYLSYPLCLSKRERPDFLLNCNGQKIGIEVTEATSEDYSEHLTYAESNNKDFIEPALFKHGEKLSKNKKNELLTAEKLISDGWAGDGAEEEWSLFIKEAIEKKTNKLQEDGFFKFNQNWLVIYENSPASFLNEEELIPYIETLFPVESSFCFDLIFIESSWFKEDSSVSEAKIFVLSNCDQKYLSVNDVWKRA